MSLYNWGISKVYVRSCWEIPKSIYFSIALFYWYFPCSVREPGSEHNIMHWRLSGLACQIFLIILCNKSEKFLIHSYCNPQCQVRYILIHFLSIHKTARLTEELFQPWSHGGVFLSYFLEAFWVHFPYSAFISFRTDFWVCCEWELIHFFLPMDIQLT